MKVTSFLFLAVSLLSLALPNFGCASAISAEKRATDQAFAFNKIAAVAVRKVKVDDPSKILSWASGVLLGRDGLVLTNKHVAEPKGLKPAEFRILACLVFDGIAGPCLPAEVIGVSSDEDDLALLRVSLPDLTPILIRPDAETMREAEEVYARLGFSSFLPPSLVYGRYVGMDPADSHALYDLAVMPGSSGGPIFDLRGRLVGLLGARTTEEGRPFSVVIPVSIVRKFLFDQGVLVPKRK
jgi:S1-C subfamily serine protease